jgi:hypothetical protein
VSNFQWLWRYSWLNVTHKTSYKRYEGKKNYLLIAFIGYVNDLNKLQQFKVSVQKSHHLLQWTFWVHVALLRSFWCSCFRRAALFIMWATNLSLVFTCCLQTSLFIHPHRPKSDLYTPNSNSCTSTPIENWTHVYMNLFTLNSPYYHLLKYLLFLLKHSVYLVHYPMLPAFFHFLTLESADTLIVKAQWTLYPTTQH